MTHKFSIGQVLQMLPSRAQSSRLSSECEVLSLLPFEGFNLQYRVQSLIEKHQRIVSEADLRVPAQAE